MADGSVQTAIEEWAITQLVAANDAYKTANPSIAAFDIIDHFTGTEHPSGVEQFLEMADFQTPALRVATWGFDGSKETDAPPDWLVTLHVYVSVYLPSMQAAPRIGTDDHIGLNKAIEIVVDTLEDVKPNVENAEKTRWAERCRFSRAVGIGQQGGLYVMDVQFDVLTVKH